MDTLKKEFNYYKANQAKLAEKYRGKYIVIVDEKICGSYNTREEAIQDSLMSYELGRFLVQFVENGDENITQTFHSRVVAYDVR